MKLIPNILGAALALSLCACGEDDVTEPVRLGTTVYFNGMVYDGASGARITAYTIDLLYFDRSLRGSVDANGRFFLGPVQPMNDYTVSIVADGYRSFLSHNAAYAMGGSSYYFDSYLFPTGLVAPDAKFTVSLSDSEEKPSGLIRLKPTSPSLLYDDASERAAGVPGQLWDNDDDLQAGAVSATLADGVAVIPGDQLTYGVTYAVTIFGVAGYQALVSPFQSGVDGDQGLVLLPLKASPITVAFRSDTSDAAADGTFMAIFSVPVEYDPPAKAGIYEEIIDGALAISTADTDGDGVVNVLKPDASDQDAERGTSVELTGNRLTIRWTPNVALATADADDVLDAVSYAGLDAVRIRPVGSDASQGVTLADVLGGSSVTVQLN